MWVHLHLRYNLSPYLCLIYLSFPIDILVSHLAKQPPFLISSPEKSWLIHPWSAEHSFQSQWIFLQEKHFLFILFFFFKRGKKVISHGSICVRGSRFSTLQLTGLSAGTEGGEPTKVYNQQLYGEIRDQHGHVAVWRHTGTYNYFTSIQRKVTFL